tara:strand:+ start:1042 stop:2310 length:1269 start_codon:yes stop_codon:yes gene_type:complete
MNLRGKNMIIHMLCSAVLVVSAMSSFLPDTVEIVTWDLLGRSDMRAIAYSGHRGVERTVADTPSFEQTKEDLRILSRMGIKWVRTYNTTLFPHTERILQAIDELKQESDFEMYVMMGAWIGCAGAHTDRVDHSVEDEEQNQAEILRAIELAKAYPDIVKIIAVGNEAMVKWQAHYVSPAVILRWVTVLKEARLKGEIPKQTLITCSDNWAALGGEKPYRNQVLEKLLGELDYLSLHTYAFHDSYYYPALRWGSDLEEQKLPLEMQVDRAVDRAIQEQANQYQAVADYIDSLGLERPIHIGETGWASLDNSFYGDEGTCVASEYIASVFYENVHQWIDEEEISCFYFEAFDEPWKSKGTAGSESHFGLFTVDGRAKYMLWDMVDEDLFNGLMRDGNPIRKTYDGDFDEIWSRLNAPRNFKFKP